MEDNIRWKTTFDIVTVYYMKILMTPHLDSHRTTDPKPEILSADSTGNRSSRDGRSVHGIIHVHMRKKDDIFRQRRLNHSRVGGGIAFRRVYPAQTYTNQWKTTFDRRQPLMEDNL